MRYYIGQFPMRVEKCIFMQKKKLEEQVIFLHLIVNCRFGIWVTIFSTMAYLLLVVAESSIFSLSVAVVDQTEARFGIIRYSARQFQEKLNQISTG